MPEASLVESELNDVKKLIQAGNLLRQKITYSQ